MSKRARTNSKAEELKKLKAIRDAEREEEQWMADALDKVDKLQELLSPYRKQVNDIACEKSKQLAKFREEAYATIHNPLYHQITICQRKLSDLHYKRRNAVEDFLSYTDSNPKHFPRDRYTFRKHFEELQDKSVDSLMSHLSKLREDCVAHIDHIVNQIASRKEEFKNTIHQLDILIEETCQEQTSLVARRNENITIYQEQYKALQKRLDEEEKEKVDALRTPEIAKIYDDINAIVKEWDEGRGEKCNKCGQIQKLSIAGYVLLHEQYRGGETFYSCDKNVLGMLYPHPWFRQ